MITFIRNYSLNYSLLWLRENGANTAARVNRAQIMCRDEVTGGEVQFRDFGFWR